MDCKSFDSPLAAALKAARKQHGLTQQDLAQAAALSVPALSRLEHGRGNLSSFLRVVDALHLEAVGRNLPARLPDRQVRQAGLPTGAHLGHRLALLRRQRSLSQRELAALVGVSVSTIVSIETEGRGRIETLERVLLVLGAGARLAPHGTKRTYHERTTSSVTADWCTPRPLLEKLYRVVGTFDLDPCSPCRGRQAPVRARMRFTPEDDGRSLEWFGTVFLNPPYGREISRWVAKARTEVDSKRAQTVIALLPVRSNTVWWHTHVVGQADVLMLRGKLNFSSRLNSNTADAPFASALVVWGGSADVISKLCAMFPDAWYIPPDVGSRLDGSIKSSL